LKFQAIGWYHAGLAPIQGSHYCIAYDAREIRILTNKPPWSQGPADRALAIGAVQILVKVKNFIFI
jgi:hypothetical protein